VDFKRHSEMTPDMLLAWKKANHLTYKQMGDYFGIEARTAQQYALGRRYLTGGGSKPVKIPKLIEIACKAYTPSIE